MYKALVFDLDGTLVDTPAGIARTIARVLANRGYPVPSSEEVYQMIGLPLVDSFLRFLPADARSIAPECVVEYRDLYERIEIPATTLFPGVGETLARFQAAGVRMAVATAKLTRVAESTLAHSGARGYFDAVLGGDCVSEPKPHPQLALSALARLECSPESALVVGDTSYDIQMGKAAGTATCGVTYGVQPRTQLAGASPDYLIDRFAELAAILGTE
ncbi:MAG TPA: HAD-IA family hydrolase [Chloroflexota bacterium]|nr:HAD-IA family hydrolase [Chloroflexota bacterium]